MKCLSRLLPLLLVLTPSLAAAQEGVVVPQNVAQDRQTPAPARPSDAGSKRRPSMVGYVEDSDIYTGVRVRFDSGWGVSAADRAEFFYAKCGCYRFLPSTNAAWDPNAPGPGPGVVTDLKFQQLQMRGEFAMTPRFSVSGTLPFRFLKPETFAPGTGSFPNESGVSDLQFGGKYAVISTDQRQVTAMFQFALPSGDSFKGLGTNHWNVEPAVLYQERPTDRVSVEAEFGEVFPTNGSAGVPVFSSQKFSGKVLYYGFGPSFEVYRKGDVAFAPVVEIVGWHVLDGYQTASQSTAGGINIANIKIGGRLLMRRGSSIYVGYGHAMTSSSWYDDIFRLEYRVGFDRHK